MAIRGPNDLSPEFLSSMSSGYLAAYAADGTLRLKLANVQIRYGSCSAYLPHSVPNSANS